MDQLEKKISSLDKSRMPVHVAMIMDGNGRWAKQQGFARSDATRRAYPPCTVSLKCRLTSA